jgi:ligand-binding sensor domain-containing protein/signal transduction histidine kinase
MWKICTRLIIFLCFCQNAYGQELSFNRAFASGELPISSINCLLQDQQGFIWIGTTDGLCRYDGQKVEVHRYNPQDSTSISNNMIYALEEDPDGRIWVATPGGLNCFLPQQEKFQRYWWEEEATEEKINTVISLYADRDGFLWFGTYHGLFRMTISNGERLHFLPDKEQSGTIGGHVIWDILEDQKGQLWLGTNNGVSRLKDKDAFTFDHFYPEPQNPYGLKTGSIFEFVQQKDGRLWLGTDSGLYLFSEEAETTHFLHFEHDPADEHTLSGNYINDLYIDKEDNLWVGTLNNGLNQLEVWDGVSEPQFKHYKTKADAPNSLNMNRVTATLKDDSGVLWVGTASNLDKTSIRPQQISYYFHEAENEQSLSHNIIKSILKDSRGNLWVGTYSGLNLLRAGTNTWLRFLPKGNPGSISHQNIFGLYEDSNSILWIATFDGLNYLDLNQLEQGAFFHQYSYSDGLPHSFIFNVIEKGNNEYWVSTYGQLSRMVFDPEKPEATTFQNYDMDENREDALVNATTYIVEQDRFGDFWIGTYNGLSKYMSKDGLEYFENYLHDRDDPESLSNNAIRKIFKDSEGRLWVGTRSGLNLVIQESLTERARFRYFGEGDGLPNDVIQSIEEDKNGYLWLSTNKGIVQFDPKKAMLGEAPVVQVLTKKEGLSSNSFVFRASHCDQNGRLYFGTASGLNHFLPEDLKKSAFKPNIQLTGLKINNEILSPGVSPDATLEKSITYTDTLQLKYWQNMLELSFAALDFNQPEAIQFTYKLNGLDQDWIQAGNRNTAIYTNLDAGKYLFEVKATNSDGVWNTAPRQLFILVLPPPWKSPLAYLLYGLCFLVGLYGVFQFRLQQKLKAVEARNKIEKARLEERALLREKNAADFHDELGHRLTKISLFLELARRNSTKTLERNTYLDKIKTNTAALSSGIRDLIWTLDPQKDSLFQTVERLRDFGNQLFESSDTNFSAKGLDTNWETIELEPDVRKHLLLLFKEAMNNCLKYAEAEKAELSVTMEGKALEISFEDNGKGLTQDQTSAGYGLKNMAKRAAKIGANWSVDSKEGEGTCISIQYTMP